MIKVLAKRLENVIGGLINENQAGFIKVRFIGDGIRLIEDMIEYTEMLQPGLILLLEFGEGF